MIKLYHFYSKNNDNKRIIVGALSFLEAANAAHDLCVDIGDQYNLNEYKLENIVDYKKYMELLDINEFYYNLPYILSENQYKKLQDNNLIKNFINPPTTRKEFDHSTEKYNCAIVKDDNKLTRWEDCVNRINEKNGISKEEIDNKLKKEDEQKINLIKDQISTILYSYVGQINNSELRNNIKKDITDLYNKYFKEKSSNVIKLNIEQLKKINELQGKIEKIRVELKNENNEKIIKESQEKIKDLNEQIRNITLKKEEV